MNDQQTGSLSIEQIRDILDSQDWQDLLPRLVRFTLYLLRMKAGVEKVSKKRVCLGKTAEDFVMDAIIKVYKGERRWDPNKDPDFLMYGMGVLRSQISHEQERKGNRLLVFVEDVEIPSRGNPVKPWVEKNDLSENVLEGFLLFIKEDGQVAAFTEFLTQGYKAREIAQRMNLSRGEVYNIRKVMKRRLIEYLNKN